MFQCANLPKSIFQRVKAICLDYLYTPGSHEKTTQRIVVCAGILALCRLGAENRDAAVALLDEAKRISDEARRKPKADEA